MQLQRREEIREDKTGQKGNKGKRIGEERREDRREQEGRKDERTEKIRERKL